MVPEADAMVPELAVPAVASLPVPTKLMTPVLAELPLAMPVPDAPLPCAPPKESRAVRAPHEAHIVAMSAIGQKVVRA